MALSCKLGLHLWGTIENITPWCQEEHGRWNQFFRIGEQRCLRSGCYSYKRRKLVQKARLIENGNINGNLVTGSWQRANKSQVERTRYIQVCLTYKISAPKGENLSARQLYDLSQVHYLNDSFIWNYGTAFIGELFKQLKINPVSLAEKDHYLISVPYAWENCFKKECQRLRLEFQEEPNVLQIEVTSRFLADILNKSERM